MIDTPNKKIRNLAKKLVELGLNTREKKEFRKLCKLFSKRNNDEELLMYSLSMLWGFICGKRF